MLVFTSGISSDTRDGVVLTTVTTCRDAQVWSFYVRWPVMEISVSEASHVFQITTHFCKGSCTGEVRNGATLGLTSCFDVHITNLVPAVRCSTTLLGISKARLMSSRQRVPTAQHTIHATLLDMSYKARHQGYLSIGRFV